MSSTWNQILSEFLINIAAGWFGAIFVLPLYSKRKKFKISAALVADLLDVNVQIAIAFTLIMILSVLVFIVSRLI